MKQNIIIIFVILVIGILQGYSKEDKVQQQMSPPPVSVVTSVAVQKEVPLRILAIGQVESYSTVKLSPQVEGKIKEVHFKPGQIVKAGELLFTIDDQSYQTELDKAFAMLNKDEAALKANKKEAKRNKSMAEREFISIQDYENIEAKREEQEAIVEADKAIIKQAKLKLNYCNITSPITGRTGAILIDPGNYVQPGPSFVLVVINQLKPCYVKFTVPQKHLQYIKKFMLGKKLRVDAIYSSGADKEGKDKTVESGILTFVDNQIDTDTGTVLLKATFDNENINLWSGMFVDVALYLDTNPNAIVVPAQAIQTGKDGGNIAFVVKNDQTIDIRPVKKGELLEEKGEIVIEKGINKGEKVVIDGQLMLYPGAKVVEKPSEDNKK
ncbi:MAG: efflux RND transporter periplasmic adaptor subunit [Desulfobacterales bacterium]|nr:efflux RND transporter periplasmic adaptor subunit [Desulfobacterales bacterium]